DLSPRSRHTSIGCAKQSTSRRRRTRSTTRAGRLTVAAQPSPPPTAPLPTRSSPSQPPRGQRQLRFASRSTRPPSWRPSARPLEATSEPPRHSRHPRGRRRVRGAGGGAEAAGEQPAHGAGEVQREPGEGRPSALELLRVTCRDCPPGSKRPIKAANRCATHHREAQRRRREQAAETRRGKVYGLQPGEYDQIKAAQGGVCFICRRATGARRA